MGTEIKAINLNRLPPEAWTDLLGAEAASEAGDLTVQEAYKAVPWLFAAVSLRAKAVSRVPFAIYRGSRDVTEAASVAWLVDELRLRLLLTEAALCLYGAGYWAAQRAGAARWHRWLLPSTIKVTAWDRRGKPAAFKRTVKDGAGVREIAIPASEMIHFWQPSLLAEGKPGTPPAEVALAAAGLLHASDKFAAAFFAGGGTKRTILVTERNIAEKDKERIESWWERRTAGLTRLLRALVVPGDIKPVVVGEGLKEASSPELSKAAREDISTAFNIPQSLLFSNASRMAVAETDERLFYDQCVLPECELIQDVLNGQLFRREGLRFEFHPERLESYQKREMEKAEGVEKIVGRPILTVNEGRAMMGYEPVPGGDELAAPAPAPVPAQGNANDDADDDAEAAREDMKRWRRKAIKSLKAVGSADVPFYSNHISESVADSLKTSLPWAETADDVALLFEEALRNV
jgi:HK97 family phage portal protein